MNLPIIFCRECHYVELLRLGFKASQSSWKMELNASLFWCPGFSKSSLMFESEDQFFKAFIKIERFHSLLTLAYVGDTVTNNTGVAVCIPSL